MKAMDKVTAIRVYFCGQEPDEYNYDMLVFPSDLKEAVKDYPVQTVECTAFVYECCFCGHLEPEEDPCFYGKICGECRYEEGVDELDDYVRP